ncbi:Uncharacterised protein [Mycobacteroides abscessus subsp. massiliense]|nr:Uncharacterised protein [Mycobacteroides abscessus subsp. massiliense]
MAPVRRKGNRMSREHQSRLTAQARHRGGHRLGVQLHQRRVVEVLTKFDQLRRAVTDGCTGPGNVLHVLLAARITAPRRGGEDSRSPNSLVPHVRNCVLHHGMPIAVAKEHRQGVPGQLQLP